MVVWDDWEGSKEIVEFKFRYRRQVMWNPVSLSPLLTTASDPRIPSRFPIYPSILCLSTQILLFSTQPKAEAILLRVETLVFTPQDAVHSIRFPINKHLSYRHQTPELAECYRPAARKTGIANNFTTPSSVAYTSVLSTEKHLVGMGITDSA